MIGDIEQAAKDLQQLLSDLAGEGVGVYERQAPRDSEGVILYDSMPYVVYSADFRAPEDEAEEWAADLFLDVWALGSFAGCYRVMVPLDDALNQQVYGTESGSFCIDRNGLCYQRADRDPADERIRRLSGQYLVRFNPNVKE